MAILQNIRLAGRMLRREPAFASASILMLALGLGATTTMFSVVRSVLLRPLPFDDAGRVVAVRPVDANGNHPAAALPDFEALRDRSRAFDALASYYHRATNLTNTDEPERLQALVVSSAFFDVLRVRPAIGRLFTSSDEAWGNHRVAVISDGMWRSAFGADANVVGRTLALDHESYTVVGVLPGNFWFLDGDDRVVVPLAFAPDDGRRTRANHFLSILGRLHPGEAPESAAADLTTVSSTLVAESPENRGLSFTVTPLQEIVVSNVRLAMIVLLAAVTALMFIGCVNLAGLAMARALARRKEAGIRLALGATPGRLAALFLTEAGLLAAVGGGLGAALAVLAAQSIRSLSPAILPRAGQVHVDVTVLCVTAALALISALAVALLPAWRNVRADITTTLSADGRGSGISRGHARVRGSLVIVQTAFAVVLLVAGGLMVRSLVRLTHVELGFDPHRVLTFSVSLPASTYLDDSVHPAYAPTATRKADLYFRAAIDRIRQLPGVQSAGAASLLPASSIGWDKVLTLWDRPLPPSVRDLPPFEYRPIAGDYFSAMGIALVRGRVFDDRDGLGTPLVAVVNHEFVRRHFGNRDDDAIGKVLSVNPPRALLPAAAIGPDTPSEPDRFTIIGVVGDARNKSVDAPADPMVYCPYSQGAEDTLTMSFAVRAAGDPTSLIPSVRHALLTLDNNQPLANIRTMDTALTASLGRPEIETDLLATFGLLAWALATFGIYALMTFAVAQRRREIAVRIALGGRPILMALDVMRRGTGLAATGALLGSGAAVVLTHAMRSMVFGIGVLDPFVFAGVSAIMVAAAALAALVPALRTARVDPATVLR